MIQGAGILFLTRDKKALFLKRGVEGDSPGSWDFPGGAREGDETLLQCAVREALEEIGPISDGLRVEWTRQVFCPSVVGGPDTVDNSPQPYPGEKVDFTTFIQEIDQEFIPDVGPEHTAFAWADIDVPPEPLHPGCRIALDRFRMNERTIAEAMASGRLISPQKYENIALFDIRITGTGVSYRHKFEEFVWRDPNIYLNQQFLDRCNGLQVILEHPPSAILNTKEFRSRTIGAIMLPYIKGKEVWGIAKIHDQEAASMMSKFQMSTSPSVVFRDPDVNLKVELESGEKLLLEGKPSLLDHVAICEHGVWDKGGDPTGVALTKEVAIMPDEVKTVAADAETGNKLDRLLSGIDTLGKRLDSHEQLMASLKDTASTLVARVDSVEKKVVEKPVEKPVVKADEDKKKGTAVDPEKTKAKEVVADKADGDDPKDKKDDKADEDKKDDKDDPEDKDKKKDDEEMKKDDSAKKEEKAKADSEMSERIKKLEAKLTPISDAEYAMRADVQARADTVFQALGSNAPRPLEGETLMGYRRRLASKLQSHSKAWKPVNLSLIADEGAFEVAEKQIYSDAMSSASSSDDLPDNRLVAVVKNDSFTGTRKIEFRGKRSFIHDFKPPVASRVTKFLTGRLADRVPN